MGELISVVIPAYNVSKYVGSAISSVMDQSYKNVEIIVVDDCSTDDTVKELEKYSDRARILRHDSNQGAAAARNTGVSACRGEIVAFLDGDDRWAPRKLEVIAECLSRHPDVSFAFSDFSRFRWSDGAFYALSNSQIFPAILNTIQRHKYQDRKYFVIPKKEMFGLLLQGYPIYPSAVVVRKRIFDGVGMWRKIRTNEDFDFGLRSCRATDGLYVDEILAMVGRHDANLSLDTHRQMEGDILVFDAHLGDPAYSRDEKDLLRYYRGKRLCGIAHSYLKSGERKMAIGKYVEAMKNGNWFWHALSRIAYTAASGALGSSTSSRTTSR